MSHNNQVVIVQENNQSCIPKVSKDHALFSLILNVFWPGLGTMILACGHIPAPGQICIGLFQMLTAWCCIGWIWAIVHSIQALTLSQLPATIMLFSKHGHIVQNQVAYHHNTNYQVQNPNMQQPVYNQGFSAGGQGGYQVANADYQVHGGFQGYSAQPNNNQNQAGFNAHNQGAVKGDTNFNQDVAPVGSNFNNGL